MAWVPQTIFGEQKISQTGATVCKAQRDIFTLSIHKNLSRWIQFTGAESGFKMTFVLQILVLNLNIYEEVWGKINWPAQTPRFDSSILFSQTWAFSFLHYDSLSHLKMNICWKAFRGYILENEILGVYIQGLIITCAKSLWAK